MTRRQLPRTDADTLDATAFLSGEIAVDLTNDELRYAGDGGELGGIALARKDGANLTASAATVTATGGNTKTLAAWTALINNLGSTAISSFMASAIVVSTAHAFAKAVDGSLTLATKAALSALTSPATNVTYVVRDRVSVGDGGGGIFRWRTGDQSANITADAQGGVWIAPDSDATGASGAWQRLTPGSEVWAAWFGAYPSASAATNATALQAWIDFLSVTGQPGRIGPGTHQTNATIIMKDGVRFKGSGWFQWTRTDYAYTDSHPTVIQGDGATLTGQNSVVFRCSQMAVGVRGDDFTAPGTSDLQDIGVEDIHFDANGAAMAAYYYRCGNGSKFLHVSHSGAAASGAGFFMAGIFSAVNVDFITCANIGVGAYIGQDVSNSAISTNLTDEAACNALTGDIYSARNTSHALDGKIARGSYLRVEAENNGGYGPIMRQTGSDSSGGRWEIIYSENNTLGQTQFYYDSSNSLCNEVTLGYRHRGSNTIVKRAPSYGDDATTVFTVTGGAGITAANLYVYLDGVRQTATTDYSVADNSSDLDVTFVTAPGSTQKIVIHGNTATTIIPDVFTIIADATDSGPSEPANWLVVRGVQTSLVSSFINANTPKWYIEGDGRTDVNSALSYIFREPERRFIRADFSERERLLNGGVSVNQRTVTSGWADDTYGPDGWYALTQTTTVTFGQQTNPENGQPFCGRLTQDNATPQRAGVAQIIESSDCIGLRNQECNFQARIKCSSSQAVRYAILEWTGTADSVTSDVVRDWTATEYRCNGSTGFFNATTLSVLRTGHITPTAATWTDFATGAIRFTPSSSMTNLILVIFSEATMAQNVTLDWGAASIKRGGQKVKWEPRDHSTERNKCQRLYWAAVAGANSRRLGLGECLSSTTATVRLQFPTTMRIAPTAVILSDVSHFGCTGSGGSVNATSNLVFAAADRQGAELTATVASGLSGGNATSFRSNNASAALAFSAEL